MLSNSTRTDGYLLWARVHLLSFNPNKNPERKGSHFHFYEETVEISYIPYAAQGLTACRHPHEVDTQAPGCQHSARAAVWPDPHRRPQQSCLTPFLLFTDTAFRHFHPIPSHWRSSSSQGSPQPLWTKVGVLHPDFCCDTGR